MGHKGYARSAQQYERGIMWCREEPGRERSAEIVEGAGGVCSLARVRELACQGGMLSRVEMSLITDDKKKT